MATNTRPMSGGYRIMLLTLGILLFLGAVKIAGAAFRESRLEPGALPAKKDLWRGRGAMALTSIILGASVYGGQKWWDYEDAEYRNNSLYKQLPVSAQVRTERDQHILKMAVDTSERRGQWTPLIPDHGKMMHLFLVRDGAPRAFAHLHPVRRHGAEFEVPLPPLPAGRYQLYADVTHENGFSETLTAPAEIPPPSSAMKRLWLGNSAEPICSVALAQMLATNLFFPPDLDDSWQMDTGTNASLEQKKKLPENSPQDVAEVSGGYKMIWENPKPIVENREVSLRFKLITLDNQPAPIEPYMGMMGHAVLRREDGAVFAHVHPLGTFSMAAQEFFVKGKPPRRSASKEPVVPELAFHSSHTNEVGTTEGISFPYAFPRPGAYRLWIQTKSQGKILTGVFDANVAAAK